MKCIHTYTHIRCIRARATATVEFTQSQGTLHVFSSFKKMKLLSLIFCSSTCFVFLCHKQRPAKSSTWSEWIWIWSVLSGRTKHVQYYLFMCCPTTEWAISIKAVWASNHNKHLHCKTIWFKRQIMFFVFCLGVFTGLLVLLFQSTVSAL